MTDRYDELMAAAEAATPGARWTDDRRGLSANRGGGALQVMVAHRGEGSLCCIATVNPWERPEANAAFIALANPETIKALLHALAEANERASLLQTENAAMRTCLERSAEGWANAIELKIIPPQHVGSASILRDEALAALNPHQEGSRDHG